jgi:hypothetical protein
MVLLGIAGRDLGAPDFTTGQLTHMQRGSGYGVTNSTRAGPRRGRCGKSCIRPGISILGNQCRRWWRRVVRLQYSTWGSTSIRKKSVEEHGGSSPKPPDLIALGASDGSGEEDRPSLEPEEKAGAAPSLLTAPTCLASAWRRRLGRRSGVVLSPVHTQRVRLLRR